MCRYHVVQYSCGHMDFSLTQNCGHVLRQLQRINDPRQLLLYDIPFEDDPKCQPNRSNLLGQRARGGCCEICQQQYMFSYPTWTFAGYGTMT